MFYSRAKELGFSNDNRKSQVSHKIGKEKGENMKVKFYCIDCTFSKIKKITQDWNCDVPVAPLRITVRTITAV